MRFSFKHLVATAAFIATNAAHAAPGYDWHLTSGTAAISFSFDGLSALSATATNVRADARIPGSLVQPGSFGNNTAIYNRATGNLNFSALNTGTSAGNALTSATTTDSVVTFRHAILDDQTGGAYFNSVYLTNFAFDLGTSMIYANVSTGINHIAPNQSAPLSNLGKMAVFSFGTTGLPASALGNINVDSVDAQGHAEGHASGSNIGPLKLTTQAADVLFGMIAPDPEFSSFSSSWFSQGSWGTFRFTANLSGTPAVPEPSSYALIGAGLAALCLMKRKRI